MSQIYVNTFGSDGRKVYSLKENHHYSIMDALAVRGYEVKGGTLKEAKGETTWFQGDTGYLVRAEAEKGGEFPFFMTNDKSTAELVTGALKLSQPGIAVRPPVEIKAPE